MSPLLYDKQFIESVIPHRQPFLMIDGILSLIQGEVCVSRKGFDRDDPFFSGHFPGRPVLPGVLILENMAQSACFLEMLGSRGRADAPAPFLAKIEACSFLAAVIPGDVMETQVKVARRMDPYVTMDAVARVGGKIRAKAQVIVGLIVLQGAGK